MIISGITAIFATMTLTKIDIPDRFERNPFEPFLPEQAQVLMMGSFPPPQKRWCMPFYYPNYLNDMWRIFGILFFHDKNHFVEPVEKKFKLSEIIAFCTQKGIAMYDTATAVRRLKDNASDQYLEVVEPTDIPALLRRIPTCRAVVTTGGKATRVFTETFSCPEPALGDFVECMFDGRTIRLYRLPSSFRAYPLALNKKADAYRRMFSDLGLL